jgi:hypothetical protein
MELGPDRDTGGTTCLAAIWPEHDRLVGLIVTADRLPNPLRMTTSVRVNGVIWTSSTLGSALHWFPAMLACV